MRRVHHAAVAVLVALAMVGCGSSRERTASAKADFVMAADRICQWHLDTVLAWLERLPARRGWQQSAVRGARIYRIIAHTVKRLQALGPAPGPRASAFTRYMTTLRGRSAL